jgi:tetratricopeptide (TPR) repeat protein
MTKKVASKPIKNKEVLPFHQTGEFHYRWAMRYLDEDNVPHALHHLWQAVELNPDNMNYNLELASLLSEMRRYDESNEILLLMMQREEAPGECYYGIGCNFWGQGDMRNATESLEQYLNHDPEGDYIEDAIVILDHIEESQQKRLRPVGPAYELDCMRERAQEGSRLLLAGEFRKAIDTLEEVTLPGDEGLISQNNLALAYFYDGQTSKAIMLVRDLLDRQPRHVYSLCNLALFTFRSDPMMAREAIGKAEKEVGRDAFLSYRVGAVLCEMGEHERARRAMEIVAAQHPYEIKIQHYYALTCYNSGEYKRASALWEQLHRMYPESSMITWYGSVAAARLRGEDAPGELPYSMQVPIDEMIRRIRTIGVRLQESRSIRELRKDEEFRKLLIWGLSLRESRLRRVMLQMLVATGGAKNERVLRRLLLNRNETDEFKHEILLGLKVMNARQPFLAIMNGNIVQVCVQVHKPGFNTLAEGHHEVIRLLRHRMDDWMPSCTDDAISLWNRFLLRLISRGKPPRLKKPAIWAAAVHFCTAVDRGKSFAVGTLARRYGVRPGSVARCVRRIRNVMKDSKKDG